MLPCMLIVHLLGILKSLCIQRARRKPIHPAKFYTAINRSAGKGVIFRFGLPFPTAFRDEALWVDPFVHKRQSHGLRPSIR